MEGVERFLDGQRFGYDTALAEMKQGEKRNHWIWYIFPQVKGLGHSPNAQYYGIKDLEEAKAYLQHPVLGPRLWEITRAVLSHKGKDIYDIMGSRIDAMKLKSSMTLNKVMVLVKILVIVLFVVVGLFYVKPANWHPFMPFGAKGVVTGAAQVFFAYLGFDVVAASAAEVKNPAKNMPRGIIGTLIICTVLYILVAAVLTGMTAYTKLDVANPVAYAFQLAGQDWFAGLLSVGALAGMFTMMVSMIFSSSRLIYSIGRDGLLPQFLGVVDTTTRVPKHSMLAVTVVVALLGGFVSLDQLTSLVNIGTLLAFTFISLGIIPLRKRQDIPNHDGFKVPFYPILPLISAACCVGMLFQLSLETWIASVLWFLIGLIIYFAYGIRHSKLNQKA